jgi:beta-phosphoglucomutase-like phosphatase (HAD superfamily)
LTVLGSGDGSVEFFAAGGESFARVTSRLGGATIYPLPPPARVEAISALLMDLDGTTVRSEPFWEKVLERTLGRLLEDPAFRFAPEDSVFISGRTVSEHLSWAIDRYRAPARLDAALYCYHEEMRAELAGESGRRIEPIPGLRALLLAAKERGVKVALVSSGWTDKVVPQLEALFAALDLGAPEDFYDTIVTGGSLVRAGSYGTVGELTSKPHPWLHREAALVGLGIPFERRGGVVGLEDSAAGVCALRIAGFRSVGVAGGNLAAAGMAPLCEAVVADLEEAATVLGLDSGPSQ